MLAHNPGQSEHRDLRLAEYRQQLGIGIDGALVGRVLQVFVLDVVPQLFDDLRTRHLFDADHCGQSVAGF